MDSTEANSLHSDNNSAGHKVDRKFILYSHHNNGFTFDMIISVPFGKISKRISYILQKKNDTMPHVTRLTK